ncbi:hypothetical protein SCLCIDRAFT_1224834 [Scleroderma citrinum Foug A]|uniref:Uncharacterized protein n=1 Tax=Scleroderma citrinum Foug A TaxID=1036808 RepID=A0A0C2ZDY4_9AGAM|nr:hypothetical protein SCLCIDRAFT_1224834 [Scleroderma citrinum Foug A]
MQETPHVNIEIPQACANFPMQRCFGRSISADDIQLKSAKCFLPLSIQHRHILIHQTSTQTSTRVAFRWASHDMIRTIHGRFL